MAGIRSKVLVVLVAALALVATASAASPDVAAMNLQAGDVPGAKVVNQRTLKERGYLAAHFRSFVFATPNGSARLVGIESETKLAESPTLARADVAIANKAFHSKAGRGAFIASIARQLKVKPNVVRAGAPRKVIGFDQSIEIPISIPFRDFRIYENLVFLSLDRVAVLIVESGLRPITAATTAKYTTAIAGHIGNELAPVAVSPPTVTGTAQQGQTLSATPGGWTAPDATFGFQWQRCDAAGANCAPVPGATASTYVVTAADVGSTLRVVVTATNRFGSAPGTSAQTAVVI